MQNLSSNRYEAWIARHLATTALVWIFSILCLSSLSAQSPELAKTRDQFITRTGNKLTSGGKTFRFAGANIYWLGLDDNIRDSVGEPRYPTTHEVDNALDAAASMGLSVIRCHTLGISLGCKNSLWPKRDQANGHAFSSIDYAIAAAKQRGLRLIIPLSDQWRYFHGGKSTFVQWAHEIDSNVIAPKTDLSKNAGDDYGPGGEKEIEQQFYNNPAIVGLFKQYIAHVLNHIGPHGVALKDDPTILAWETGNELFDAPPTWTESIGSFIKHDLQAQQLIADGSAASGLHVSAEALANPSVDIVGGHFYAYPSGLDVRWLELDANLAAKMDNVYVLGEWGWSMAQRDAWLAAIERNDAIAGDLFWSILPYQANGSAVPHASLEYGKDDVPLYVPALDKSQQMQAAIESITAHSRRLQIAK